ncbi:YciI family protein [Streptosporangium carneum]|uniref:Transcription initiation protein n=1 Tax=Streptosporangium carneum TaxID=47481 RepID=A0A9W6I6Z6_9ACTN|nr:YciI family protein [Streptosporangium carneum]GLK12323.1 transcription initiation protein [Streptosporangium carneum]
MPQYAILIYERETPNGVADLPPEVLEAHMRVPERVEELGGKILNAHATQPTSTATTIRGDVITDGPFIESKEAMAGFFVVEARDLDHAVAIGRLVPIVSGGVEVRPLLAG